ncbi:hypothetical protein SteCoe_20781 [Stentor coeruleus]|uniref:Uncharacterized protein n=1 Tax=Stentor coeruleus TaxID=5963 RepID=A0A1R2BQX4_9CILI|nr:hypothetical protein SteCoe_20781 [Stentor coeruleus]
MIFCVSCGKRATNISHSQGAFCLECLENHIKNESDRESFEEIRFILPEWKKNLFTHKIKDYIKIYEDCIDSVEKFTTEIKKKFENYSSQEIQNLEYEKQLLVENCQKKISKFRGFSGLETFNYKEFLKVKKIMKIIPFYNVSPLENGDYEGVKKKFSKMLMKFDKTKSERLANNFIFWNSGIPLVHHFGISCLSLSKDKKFLGTASNNGDLCIWDATSGNAWKYFRTNIDLRNCELAMNIRVFIFSGKNKIIYGWNVDFDREEFQLSGHSRDVLFLKISNNGEYLASKSKDSTIKIWNLKTRQEHWSIKLEDVDFAELPSMCFCKNDEYFVYLNSKVCFWNIKNNLVEKVIGTNELAINSFAIGNDEKKMVFVDGDYKVKFWDLERWNEIDGEKSKKLTIDSAHGIEISDNYKYAFIKSPEDGILVWDLNECEEVAIISEKKCGEYIPDTFNQVMLTNDKKVFISYSTFVIVYDLFDQKILSIFGTIFEAQGLLSKNAKFGLAISSYKGRGAMLIYNLLKRRLHTSFLLNKDFDKKLTLTDCGNYIIIKKNKAPTILLDVRSPQIRHELNLAESDLEVPMLKNTDEIYAKSAITSVKEEYLALYNQEMIQVWRLSDHKLVLQRIKVKSLWISSDMSYAIILGENERLFYWSIPENKAQMIISENAHYIKYFPKKHLIVYIHLQDYIIWDCKSKKQVITCKTDIKTLIYDIPYNGNSAYFVTNNFTAIKIYNLENGSYQVVNPFASSNKAKIVLLSTSTDGSLLILVTSKNLYIYNFIEEAKELKTTFNTPPISLSFTPDNNSFLAGFEDGIINLWDLKTDSEIWTKKVLQNAIVQLEISDNSFYCNIRFQSNICAMYDLRNCHISEFHGLRKAIDFRFSENNSSVILVNKRLITKIYDINSASVIVATDFLEKERKFIEEYPEFKDIQDEYKELRQGNLD